MVEIQVVHRFFFFSRLFLFGCIAWSFGVLLFHSTGSYFFLVWLFAEISWKKGLPSYLLCLCESSEWMFTNASFWYVKNDNYITIKCFPYAKRSYLKVALGLLLQIENWIPLKVGPFPNFKEMFFFSSPQEFMEVSGIHQGREKCYNKTPCTQNTFE